MNSTKYTLNEHNITEVFESVKADLSTTRLHEQILLDTTLISEELLLLIAEQYSGEELTVSISGHPTAPNITYSFPGRRFSINEDESQTNPGIAILTQYDDKITFKYQAGVNYITIKTKHSYAFTLLMSVIAVIAAIPVSFVLLHFFGHSDTMVVINNYLLKVEEMFGAAMALLATPITFLSLSLFIAKNYNLFENRSNNNILVKRYMSTSFCAVLIGFFAFYLLIYGIFRDDSYVVTLGDTDSVREGLNNVFDFFSEMIPESVFSPFSGVSLSSMLFLSVLFGIALGQIGGGGIPVVNISQSLNRLFCQMLSMISNTFPIFVFISCVELNTSIEGAGVLVEYAFGFASILLGLIIALILYSAILFFNKISPVWFWKQCGPSIITIFKIGSSISAIPYTIRVCRRRLGIPTDFLKFAIPLGANINMDANCITMSILSLGMLYSYDQTISLARLIELTFIIVLLSVGAPNQPGSCIICMTVLTPFIGITQSSISAFIIYDALLGMFLAGFNVIGDMVSTALIAKRLGILNPSNVSSQKEIPE